MFSAVNLNLGFRLSDIDRLSGKVGPGKSFPSPSPKETDHVSYFESGLALIAIPVFDSSSITVASLLIGDVALPVIFVVDQNLKTQMLMTNTSKLNWGTRQASSRGMPI